MKRIAADVYSTPENFQTVPFEYESIRVSDKEWFSNEPDTYEVNCIKLKMPLYIEPSDLEEDLKVAIAEDLGVDPYYVKIDCIVETMPVLTINEIAA
jgi:hypothetical protein